MLEFSKYVAAGNDFVVFDGTTQNMELSRSEIIALCHRRFGIGADGVIVLSIDEASDFRMNYFNADGSRGEMCGNGARAIVHFAHGLGMASRSGRFKADDGYHEYLVEQGQVSVEINVSDTLQDWNHPQPGCGSINTGVPHIVYPVSGLKHIELDPLGHAMNDLADHPEGANLNIIEKQGSSIGIRTWERGVNMETLACGTGATAASIFAHEKWGEPWPIDMLFPGGKLTIDHRGNQYWLAGPVELVFAGQITLTALQHNE